MTKYGNLKSKENNSRNKGSSPQSNKAVSSPGSAGNTADAYQKTERANPAQAEASSQQQPQAQQQMQPSAQDGESREAAPADDDKQSESNVTESEVSAPGTSTSNEGNADDEADELEAEKARRHDEPSHERKPDEERRP